ncbi:histidyl-tRNA synthetase family protein [Cryptosporidium muris RN66]|uniref:Histidine--tRNA ligase, cytoplasmic n=1 Tax=Cryptosporidium muris (strain RN66) TaxID=441375 RepID=B6AHE5_CRYMR|nr:histidyl-tRNA synthetase family protein [Cryptosporidium muris RN66]EEA07640.1 histidyl-tRNA synthetase family protein [Cryptosporidium muris RN66]|eukprot:XP_002141989.1 histidyl-tRNA synthetase family protein [Cryptosporidium muris RN66]
MELNEPQRIFIGVDGISTSYIPLVATNINCDFVIDPQVKTLCLGELTENIGEIKTNEVISQWEIPDFDISLSRELNSFEARALLFVRGVTLAMNSKGVSYKFIDWLLKIIKENGQISLRQFNNDYFTLVYLLKTYISMTGSFVSPSEGVLYTSGFTPKISQITLSTGILLALKKYAQCVLALIIESLAIPTNFLVHIISVSAGGVAETARNIKWLLEDSKVERNTCVENYELLICLSNTLCYLGSLKEDIENMDCCIKGYLTKNSNIKVSTKGIGNSLYNIEITPIFPQLSKLILSISNLKSTLHKLVEILIPKFEAEIFTKKLDVSISSGIGIEGIDIKKVLKIPQTTIESIKYIKECMKLMKTQKLAVSETRNEEETSTLFLLTSESLKVLCLLNVLSLQRLGDINRMQCITAIEKALLKGKISVKISTHESRNIHQFRELITNILVENLDSVGYLLDNSEPSGIRNYCEYLFDSLNNGGIYNLLNPLIKIMTTQNQIQRKPKVPKGTQDIPPQKMVIRNVIFDTIRSIFRSHGAVEIDTPIFELRDTLIGKYGEDSKLIYDLKDQGGEQLSLRYDLTVPLARYIASAGLENLKRFQIGKVYRRDEPQMSRGRYREFYQCDLDICGIYEAMTTDVEILKIATDILNAFSPWIGSFIIKINHRSLLDGLLIVCGVPKAKIRTICSSIDKLDKESWESVKKEMVTLKGLSEEVADKIGNYIKFSGAPGEVLTKVKQCEELINNEDIKLAISDMVLLFSYTDAVGCTEHLSFDLSLARGLDYYTGIIYEAVLTSGNVGSIAAGGRYDNLIGMFSQKNIPAVGFSVGVERIMNIIEKKLETNTRQLSNKIIRGSFTEFLICTIGDILVTHKLKLASMLWTNGISAEISPSSNAKLRKQLEYAASKQIPFCIIVGEDEVKRNTVQIRQVNLDTHIDKSQVRISEEVSLNSLISRVKDIISKYGSSYDHSYAYISNQDIFE